MAKPTQTREDIYTFVPALRWRALSGFYDLACALAFLGKSYKRSLLASVPFTGTEQVLDVGCGTGLLLEVLTETHPAIKATGADADPALLAVTRERLAKRGAAAELVEAYAEELPFPDDRFDIVFCTLTLHHVPSALKVVALREMRRVLKPGGVLVLSDYGKKDPPVRALSQVVFEKKEDLEDHFAGKIPGYIAESGLRIESEDEFRRGMFTWVARK